MFGTRLELTALVSLSVGLALVAREGDMGQATRAPEARRTATAAVSFADDVKPILDNRCIQCHGGVTDGELVMEVSLDLTTYEGIMAGSEYGEVVVPGDPDESMIVVLIEDGDMPEEGDPATPEEIETIRTWIAEGAENN